MASFEELQALAAARSKASQAKLAAERAQREAIEQEKKLALETKARQDHQKERELLVAREQKRKRDEEQRKQTEMERKKMLEKREREKKEREKYGMDVVKFRNATEKAINNAGGKAKLKKKMKARDREGQDSVSPPPNLREYSTLTREEKRKKKEAAMLGLVTIGKRKAPSFSSHVQQQMKTASAANGLVPLGTHKRDTRSVDEIERDLIASRRAKISMQGSRSQRDKLLEEEKREKELETMLRRTKAMQEKRSMEESRQKSMTRSGSDSSDEERRPSNGRHKIDLSASMSAKPKSKNYEPKRDNSSSNSGLNPADYLPGAPIKTSILPKAVNKPRQAAAPVKSKRDTSRDAIEKAGPPKKETPREKFLREEAEKKRQRERQRESRKKIEDVSDEEDSDSEEEDESKEGESEESEEEDLPHSSKRAKIRDEIWSLFNRKDKSEYLARDIDSDDDMEADMESVRREEERSARIARLEDKREEEAQRRREQEKAQRKAAKERR